MPASAMIDKNSLISLIVVQKRHTTGVKKEVIKPSEKKAVKKVVSQGPKGPIIRQRLQRDTQDDAEIGEGEGRLHWPTVDEEYAISYVFKGAFKKTIVDCEGNQLEYAGDGFYGLKHKQQYELRIEEDPDAEKSGPIDIVNAEGVGSRRALDGDDKSSCSCIEGNPCAVPYNCLNWENRFEIAEKVMKNKGMKA
ncbi:hypothetical protein CYMTET_52542 [Cymbomonas tetramitiformis]|uniref:Uncharacterized protein n=1 Tax=Cymbomonas tetramitiformis TaxID=36881 RepID=A0AAE0BJ23_9CHLO|nr:hypothetical protein CYMTET_52542 [Cymbomonas tetramitiformis]